ncbi:MAG: S8 family serine peptidase [Clostridia bacterium]|nr:S8 family serine peptidase [Clostridia bacterium]
MKQTLKRVLAIALIAAMAFSALALRASTDSVNAKTNAPEAEQASRPVAIDPSEIVSIIVKLEDEPVLARMSVKDSRSATESSVLKQKQQKVISAIASKLVKDEAFKVDYQYTLLFNGFSFHGEYRLIDEIKALPGVANCYRSNVYQVPEDVKPEGEDGRLGTSVGWINADDMWALGYTGQGQTIAVIDTGIKTNHPNFATAPQEPHFTAAGIQSVLDQYELCAEQSYNGTLTGNQLYHSAKIPYTFNYYRGSLDVSHADARSDHGTHVSSIAAGNDNSARGVAYNAQIVTMQVFQNGGAEWSTIMAALEDCAYLEVDAVNMSLGADCGFTEEDEDMDAAYALLSQHGVNVAVASGNSGTTGSGNNYSSNTPTLNIDNGLTSTPGTNPGSLSVAASSDSAAASVTYFSSRGTTSDLRIKPEIMAPGDNINAATDSSYSGGNYGTKSGTSMATPHIAGGMVLVNQYVNSNFPNLSEKQRMEMVNTLLMSTAVPSKSGGTPYLVRAQGAGQANLTAAINTKAYLEVPGQLRPKLELGDDDDYSGIFSLSFDVVNFGNTALTYTVNPYVLTESTQLKSIGGRQLYCMTDSALNITDNVTVTKPSTVTVPANGRATVNVTINVSPYASYLNERFPNGAYIEGYVTLDGTVDLSIPFLGFYGDWEKAAVFDREYYYDAYLHTNTLPAAWGVNTAKAGDKLLGVNPFGTTTDFYFDRASISPNNDGVMDAIDDVRTYLLRSCETFRYEVLNAQSGAQLYVKDIPLMTKGVENSWLSQVEPVGSTEESAIDAWNGDGLANGSSVILRMTGFMQSWDEFDPAANENAIWEIPVTIDIQEPEVVYWNMNNGQLALYVSDNHYVAFAGVYSNAACTQLIASQSVEEHQRGATSILDFNVGNRDTVYVKLGDYAGNSIIATVTEGEGGSLEPVALEGVSFETGSLEIFEGFSGALVLIREPANANSFDVEWSSADPSIATVSGGLLKATVTGVHEGTTTVTARATDRDTNRVYTANATIIVNDYPTVSEALNAQGGNIAFTTTGSYPWVVEFKDNRACIKSTNQGVNSSNSTVTSEPLTLEAGDKLSFTWSVSSESNYDKLKFYVNNSEIHNISGAVNWTNFEYTVPSNGSFTFKWVYEKDSSVHNADDTAWVDDVSVTYVNPPEPSYLLGDCDLNGAVQVADAVLAMRHSLGLTTLTGDGFLAGDVNLDGSVNMGDAVQIMRYALELINEF